MLDEMMIKMSWLSIDDDVINNYNDMMIESKY
jgi:hypothetical protein